MAEEDVVQLLQQVLVQMEAQQQALVGLTEVLDRYLKEPVRVDVVANAPKVSLTEDNSVGINPPNNHVVVDNFPEIRDRNAPGVESFQRVIDVRTNGGEAETPVNVPGGKRLVIEFVSTLSHENANVFLRTVANGVSAKHAILGSAIVRIYADPGTSVFLRVERTGGGFSSAASASITVSGHLVNV
jgi:hypothetical protein